MVKTAIVMFVFKRTWRGVGTTGLNSLLSLASWPTCLQFRCLCLDQAGLTGTMPGGGGWGPR